MVRLVADTHAIVWHLTAPGKVSEARGMGLKCVELAGDSAERLEAFLAKQDGDG